MDLSVLVGWWREGSFGKVREPDFWAGETLLPPAALIEFSEGDDFGESEVEVSSVDFCVGSAAF